MTTNGIINDEIARNFRRIINDRMANYKNVVMERRANCISFIEVSDQQYRRPICKIIVREDHYALVGSIDKGIIHVPARNYILDRFRIHRWLHKIIKNYRRW